MAEHIAYLERLLWGGKRDKRVAQGPTLFDAFFNEAAENQEGSGEAPRLRAEEAGASGTLSVHGTSGRMASGISQGHQSVGI